MEPADREFVLRWREWQKLMQEPLHKISAQLVQEWMRHCSGATQLASEAQQRTFDALGKAPMASTEGAKETQEQGATPEAYDERLYRWHGNDSPNGRARVALSPGLPSTVPTELVTMAVFVKQIYSHLGISPRRIYRKKGGVNHLLWLTVADLLYEVRRPVPTSPDSDLRSVAPMLGELWRQVQEPEAGALDWLESRLHQYLSEADLRRLPWLDPSVFPSPSMLPADAHRAPAPSASTASHCMFQASRLAQEFASIMTDPLRASWLRSDASDFCRKWYQDFSETLRKEDKLELQALVRERMIEGDDVADFIVRVRRLQMYAHWLHVRFIPDSRIDSPPGSSDRRRRIVEGRLRAAAENRQ